MSSTIKITKNIIVFYHENCLDGFASSYTANKKFKNKADYIPLSHTASGDGVLKAKKIKINDLKDKQVYFIDFCPKEKELKSIQKVVKQLVVIDHHIGAKELVKSLENGIFQDGVSGAYLASKYFFPKDKVSKFIEYISIGDIWTWKNEKLEREVLAYIRTISFDYKAFAKVEKDLEDKNKFIKAREIGKLLLENYSKMVDGQILKAKLINFDKYKVYAVNASSVFSSELGHKLAIKSKDKFSIVYYFENDKLKISLRGEGRVNLSELAKKYSGGGHFNAAGFSIEKKSEIEEFLDRVIGK